jgi:DeoR/GlpR family transcriptional regulator of sugar metabolism
MVAGRQCVNVHVLAHQLRVSSRTIRRDLVALHTAGEHVPAGYERDMTESL